MQLPRNMDEVAMFFGSLDASDWEMARIGAVTVLVPVAVVLLVVWAAASMKRSR